MNTNDFILTSSYGLNRKGEGVFISHLYFEMLHSIDQKSIHIPKWFKDHRVIKLLNYLIYNRYLRKDQIVYKFTWGSHNKFIQAGKFETELILNLDSFIIQTITIEESALISRILPAPDLEDYVEFKLEEKGTWRDLPPKVSSKRYYLKCQLYSKSQLLFKMPTVK